MRRATLAALLLLRVAAPRPLGSKAARVAAPRPPPKRALPEDCANNTLIFGVGLPKSGTRSLGAAASALGITSAKGMTRGEHGVEYGFRKHLIPFAAGSANASNPLRRLDEHAWATSTLYTDFPFYALSCALAAAYPRALFVDVRRDCDAWAQSALSQLFCVWLRAGCMRAETFCAKRATNVPKTHIAVGFCTTK
ncbi:hypothetical protein SO694_00018314 [Aureococcus anophagefferens]|uniref:Sulfotransferase domain-containing protein n=1 Tax=Aureococcus anophagefferens TaxID=44056 RepID=A0ABR1G0K9_AURAN